LCFVRLYIYGSSHSKRNLYWVYLRIWKYICVCVWSCYILYIRLNEKRILCTCLFVLFYHSHYFFFFSCLRRKTWLFCFILLPYIKYAYKDSWLCNVIGFQSMKIRWKHWRRDIYRKECCLSVLFHLKLLHGLYRIEVFWSCSSIVWAATLWLVGVYRELKWLSGGTLRQAGLVSRAAASNSCRKDIGLLKVSRDTERRAILSCSIVLISGLGSCRSEFESISNCNFRSDLLFSFESE
jgi:hypothetical protein